ncbi:hypothetical protein M404DRAFT_782597 [Pisolithus tinctorius Marx 270]|uniref:Uncharacterized protein n=1 Tax=Pisolithus tinctorius Marx 270 TaxID=870435 RepID=A0A0C3NWM3_PISTI|nr:hypothetical protein M404DRAFT_782597 [Pisolithus tinctorius Marx 270]
MARSAQTCTGHTLDLEFLDKPPFTWVSPRKGSCCRLEGLLLTRCTTNHSIDWLVRGYRAIGNIRANVHTCLQRLATTHWAEDRMQLQES